jgi:hypothetical protein
MTPAEIDASVEEPNWIAQWAILQCADDGFDAILRQWRRWHWTPIEVDGEMKKKPAGRVDGIIGLALQGITAFTVEREPFEEQHDDHMWLLAKGRAWRILYLRGKVGEWAIVNSFGDEWHLDLVGIKWEEL